jgi:hypothetical protein
MPATRRYLGSPGRPTSRDRHPARVERRTEGVTSVIPDVRQDARTGPGYHAPTNHPTHGSTGRPLHPNSSSPAPRPATCPRKSGQTFGSGPPTGENPGWMDGSSDLDGRPGPVKPRWAARGEQGTRTSRTCVTETRHRVRGGVSRQGREKRRRRTEAGVEARDEVHCRCPDSNG